MTLTEGPGGLKPISLREPVVRLLRDAIHEKIGVFFESARFDTMLEKIQPRAAARGCRSYLDYYYMLKYDAGAAEEWRRVMDAFSVQETYFWREYEQIRSLAERIVPGRTAPLRVWSAACASGEEPYSIALALAEAGRDGAPVEILASDASEAALARARRRFYRERSFRALPPPLRARYFEAEGDGFVLRPEIAAAVTFRWANLLDLDALPEAAAVDVIYCRNVFIYFSPEVISRVVAGFARRLPRGGQLFVGASESLLKLTDEFELRDLGGAFVYVRR